MRASTAQPRQGARDRTKFSAFPMRVHGYGERL
jgi:hypothetical protein